MIILLYTFTPIPRVQFCGSTQNRFLSVLWAVKGTRDEGLVILHENYRIDPSINEIRTNVNKSLEKNDKDLPNDERDLEI